MRRIQAIFVLVAWLAATGAQWDLAQVVAWGRMYANYSRQMSASAAFGKTFKGELCTICVAVQEGRRDQSAGGGSATETNASGKQSLKFAPTVGRIVYAPSRAIVGVVAPWEFPAGLVRETPPTPPPRAAA